MNRPGAGVVFVVVEGIDGAGKSTFAARLATELRRRDRLPVQLSEPSYGPLGQEARQLLAKGVAMTDPRLNELFLADRRDHTARRTRPLLAIARDRPGLRMVLVQDRSYYSSQAYQGLDDAAARADIERYERVTVRPDLVLVLDVPLEVAAERIARRPAAEQDVTSVEVLGRARAVYLELAARLPHFAVLDGTRAVDALADEVASRYWPPD